MAALVLLMSVLIWSFNEFRHAKNDYALAGVIQENFFERASFADQYFLYREDRVRTQWGSSKVTADRLFRQADLQFQRDIDQHILGRLRRHVEDSVLIFQRLIQNTTVLTTAGINRPIYEELDKRLVSQMLLKTMVLRDASTDLKVNAARRVEQTYERLTLIIMVFGVLLALSTILTSLLLIRLVRQRLAPLHKGARLVAGGDLTHRIKPGGADEFAELAQSINAMTDSLDVSTRQLKAEIGAHQQSEVALGAALSRLNNIASRVPGMVYEYRLYPDGRSCFPFASEAIREIYRVSPQDVRDDASPVFSIIHPDDRDALAASIQQSATDLTPWRHEFRVRFDEGTVRWLFGNSLPQRLEDGSVCWHGFITDITEHKQDEYELRIAAVAFASPNGMMITDRRGVILRVNPSFTRLTGYSAEEAIGQTPALLSSGRQGRVFYQRMWEVLREKGFWQGEIWNKRKNGQIYAELLAITAVVTADRGVSHYVGTFSDITEDLEAAAEIHRLAYYDPLTRLPNRRLLQDRIGQAITATARNGQYGAIFFLDLDNFKALNDTRGHDVGDLLLVEVAQRLQKVVREGDTVARQGGDEFVLLLEDLGDEPNQATELAQQLGDTLREAIDRPFSLKGHDYHCKASIGISLFNAQDSVDELFRRADLAMYQAKNAGRNTLRFFDPAMQRALALRSALEAELHQALDLKQLRLFYQPQVDFMGRVIGVEALLRWQHPLRGLMLPNDFIPLAEATGLILPIGLWVLETACAQLATWATDASTQALEVAVNVSARQFKQPDFVAQVRQVLDTSGANPARLKLELTESLVLENVEDTIDKMQVIKRLGVKFSMDDFGTGYSSLSYLAQLPLDQLKIDRSFICNLPGTNKDETIARTIITLGRGLGMNVIAEGVETPAQREFLEAHGCHAFQGYLFSQPLPLDELEDFVKRAHSPVVSR